MNIQQMMKQAQALQMKVAALQEELRGREQIGLAGGGKVKVTMNGANEILSVEIAPDVVRPEESDLLEDLVLAACRDARTKVTAMVETEMKKVTGGMGLPPGLF
ncbi:MAG TPA: YbaB/EbfC family nucleoid-associated protein [Candidatus Eisenbacteria bacterium]|nr:YbaB/EbfC family nucleoid-associated protein [Candidatus Eisenbacteria bacterium]